MHRGQASELRKPPPLRRMGPDLRRPVGADEHHRDVQEVAGEELEQVPAGPIGPVEILDTHRHDPIGGQPADHVEDRDEQSPGPSVDRRGVRGWVEPPSERGEVFRLVQQGRGGSANLAEQVGEGRQRDDVAADGHAPPEVESDPGPGGGLADER